MSDPGITPDPGGSEDPSEVQSTTKLSVIHKIVDVALHQPLLILTAALVAAVVGVWSFTHLPIDAYPGSLAADGRDRDAVARSGCRRRSSA